MNKSSLIKLTHHRLWLVAELVLIFLVIPLYFYFNATRWNIHAALWIIALYATIQLEHGYGYTFEKLWHGREWSDQGKTIALIRFLICIPLIIGLTFTLVPDRLFSLPLHRTVLWLAVMVLYPFLSVVPQEIVFRSFFFERYKILLSQSSILIGMNALAFGFTHIVFHNWVSPLLCVIGGLMFAHSYSEHRSLKWATLEHAAYGCMVFTAGIGAYFLVNGFRIS